MEDQKWMLTVSHLVIRCQFYQCFMHAFFVQTSFLTNMELEKAATMPCGHLTWMKLTTGVNFINFLQADFMCADPKSAKKADSLTVFLHFPNMRA